MFSKAPRHQTPTSCVMSSSGPSSSDLPHCRPLSSPSLLRPSLAGPHVQDADQRPEMENQVLCVLPPFAFPALPRTTSGHIPATPAFVECPACSPFSYLSVQILFLLSKSQGTVCRPKKKDEGHRHRLPVPPVPPGELCASHLPTALSGLYLTISHPPTPTEL